MDSPLLEQDLIMLRPYQPTDSDTVLDLWLKASIQAHDFVPETFWYEQLPAMRELYLPQAETLVLEENGHVLGFASLREQRLAALFVSPSAQGRRLGRQLLDEAKRRRDNLELGVYRANTRAVAFYRANDFMTLEETRDPHTGQPELTMHWSRG
jgi:putative acetyltransferase